MLTREEFAGLEKGELVFNYQFPFVVADKSNDTGALTITLVLIGSNNAGGWPLVWNHNTPVRVGGQTPFPLFKEKTEPTPPTGRRATVLANGTC